MLSVRSTVPVPHTPSYIGGVFNRHGRVTAVFDLALYIGEPATATTGRHVVVQHGELDAAIPVNEIIGAISTRPSEWQRPLASGAAAKGFVLGELIRGEEIFSVVDVGALVEGGRLERGA